MPVRKEQLARTAVAPRAVPAAEQPEVLLLRKLRLAGRRFPHLPCSGPGLRVSAAASPSPGPRSGHRRPRRARRGCGAPSGRRGRARRGAPLGGGDSRSPAVAAAAGARLHAMRSSLRSLGSTSWQRSGSVSCFFLLSLQLADFNKENLAVCFPCALKLETCLVPTAPLRAGRSKYGRARRRWGSVLPEERIASLFPPVPPGQSAPGGGVGAVAPARRSAGRRARVLGGGRAGGGVRCPGRARARARARLRPRREGQASPGKAPRRAASARCGRGGKAATRGESLAGKGAGAAALAVSRRPGDARAGAGICAPGHR